MTNGRTETDTTKNVDMRTTYNMNSDDKKTVDNMTNTGNNMIDDQRKMTTDYRIQSTSTEQTPATNSDTTTVADPTHRTHAGTSATVVDPARRNRIDTCTIGVDPDHHHANDTTTVLTPSNNTHRHRHQWCRLTTREYETDRVTTDHADCANPHSTGLGAQRARSTNRARPMVSDSLPVTGTRMEAETWWDGRKRRHRCSHRQSLNTCKPRTCFGGREEHDHRQHRLRTRKR